MKGKLFFIAAALCAVTGITSYAQNAGDISITEGVECYPFYDRVTVSSETERDIAVYTAVYGADGTLKSVTKSEKKVQAETEFMNVYPELEQGETFKTMIWDDKQTPLAAAITEIPEKKEAAVTVHFTDEEGNVLKDPVKLDGEFYVGGKFTMPAELTADFAVMTDGGKRNLYQLDESKSDMSAILTENTELTLVFNMVTQYDYYEDFEDYTVNQSAWHLGKDSSLPTVEDGTLHYASKGATAGAWTTFDELDCTGKKVKIEADIKFAPTGTAGNSQFSIGNTAPSFDGGNISYGITGSGGNAAGHVIGLEYKEGKTFLANGQNVDTGFIGDWMHVDAEADFVSKKVTIKITNAAGKSAEIKDVSFYSSCANNIGSMYVRAAKPNGTVEVDNVAAAIIGDGVAVDPDVKSPLNFKTVYAFGDSIVQGHNAPNNAFMNLLANKYSMYLTKYSKNGATVIKSSNDVITQVKNASADEPDFVVFDGYTNDAYDTVLDKIGTIQGADATAFDNSTFCGAFEEILYTMRQKWPNTKIVFVTIHKSGARDFEIQTRLHDLTVEMCEKWGVSVVDMFTDATLDTRDPEQMEKYIINGNGSHPNVTCCEEFYVPMIADKMTELCEGEPEATRPPSVEEHSVTYSDENGTYTIYGKLYRPAGDPRGTVIFSHGFNGGCDDFKPECEYLSDNGYASYSFEFCGGSNRKMSKGRTTTDMTVFTEKADLLAVFDDISKLDGINTENMFLAGGSQGGLISALAAEELLDKVKAMVLYFPAYNIPDNWRSNFKNESNIPETYNLWGFTLGKVFFTSIRDFYPFKDNNIGKYKGDVLILHGDADNIVPLSYSRQALTLYEHADLVVFPKEGHGFSAAKSAEAREKLLAFIQTK